MLTNSDIAELTDWRRDLHRHPELSGQEHQTAATVADALRDLGVATVLTGLGGTGVAGVIPGAAPGPTVLFRAELDALPIQEITGLPHCSQRPMHGHMCGHDGHMATLIGLARLLMRRPPARGRAVLMFQPAEETGAGARAVIADPRYDDIAPDWAFALHNMPGLPFGHAGLCAGAMACASAGLRAVLHGRTSHASAPETGNSPAPALARLIPALDRAGPGGALQPGFRLATIGHIRLGEPAFGIAPGEAEIRVTLRALTQPDMDALIAEAEGLIRAEATAGGFGLTMTRHEVFAACFNDDQATATLTRALETEGIPHDTRGMPMRASEDFGLFGHGARAAMLFLGAGEDHPMLHAPDFDFPDGLIERGARIFHRVARDLLG